MPTEMTMFSILVSTPFLDAESSALFHAASLASQVGATLLLHHSYDFIFAAGANQVEYHRLKDASIAEANELLAKLAEKVEHFTYADGKPLKVSRRVTRGQPSKEVKKLAKEKEVMLFALNVSPDKAKHKLFGHNLSASLQNDLSCGVFVIPENYSFVPYTHVVYGISDTHDGAHDLVNMLLKYVKNNTKKLEIFHVEDDKELDFSYFHSHYAEALREGTLKLVQERYDDVLMGIKSYLSTLETALLVLNEHSTVGGFFSIFQKQNTLPKQLYGKLENPCLVVPSKEGKEAKLAQLLA